MAKKPPMLKTSSDARAHNGSATAFKDSKIKGAKVIETHHPSKLRTGFTKKLYTVPCGKGGLPGA